VGGDRQPLTRWVKAASILGGAFILLWFDGWFAAGGTPHRPTRLAPALTEAFARAAADLAARARSFSEKPDVSRSLLGGGVVVDRAALFAAAREAVEGAPPGVWVALTDRAGNVHAWWGETPSPVPQLSDADGFSALWSATTLTLVYRRSVGKGPREGVVATARSFPVRAPDFGAALGLAGEAAAWRPVGRPDAAALFRDGEAFVAAVPADRVEPAPSRRGLPFGLVVVAAIFGFARSRGSVTAGIWLALLFLLAISFASPQPRALGSPTAWPLAIGVAAAPTALAQLRGGNRNSRGPVRVALGYGLLIASLLSATRIEPPELTGIGQGGLRALLDLAGLTAVVVAALAFGAAGRGRTRSPQKWLTAAVVLTTAMIVASLAVISAAPAEPAAVLLMSVAAFELWARAVGSQTEEPFVLPRLLVGAALLLVLIVSPLREHARASEAFRIASAIRVPEPDLPSASAAAAAQYAVTRIGQIDLRRDLPAPTPDVDLSDLAYRIWRDGADGPEGRALISYEIFDGAGRSRSRFSLIPEAETPEEAVATSIRIDRFRVAVVRRIVGLRSGDGLWGLARVEVADWPSWDPLPPRIGVYRRLVLGAGVERAPFVTPRRPLLASYAPDGEGLDEGPRLSPALLARLRGADRPQRVRLLFGGQLLYGEVRSARDGYRLIALPLPDFFGRLLTAALLIPGVVLVYLAGSALLLGRLTWQEPRGGVLPGWVRTFRGRLVALYVLGVLVPLFAVTFFLRSQIETRSQRETVDHARTALGTARRVLDDYLPSAAAARGRLGLLDDTLIAWLANAVGYDLSVYGPDGSLIATSRRDLYASGLLPDRASASVYVSVGLQGAAQLEGSRRVAGSRFEEVTSALRAVPGVPGLTAPALLSLLLLPQQEVAAWAFSVLIFLVSAGIAGRLAVRVARPVADLVEGTRAVSRGDFSPRIPEPPDEELRELVRAFLSMSQSLRTQTEAVSREKERLATLLSHLTAGVVAFGEGGRVLLANPAAVSLGGGGGDASTVDALFPGDAMRAVRAVLHHAPERPVTAEVEPRPGERWRIVSVPLPLAAGGDRMAVIEDVSDVVRSNRLAAWAEMARIIAHEIKNPLTPIRLSVEHLLEVWRRGSDDFDRVLEECVSNVLRQTEELRRSAAEFADYSRLPRPEKAPVDLGRAMREGAAAFAGAPGIRWRLRVDPTAMADADPRLLARVFSNLIGNAVEALGSGGGEIALGLNREAGRARVAVEDDGPGVSPDILTRLFDPYFSARSGGTGLGLAIVKKIVEEHGGTISAENRPEGGFRVSFDLPLSEAAETAGARSAS
jgi:signal transduction histidine kinase/HAMP domain-containing protein